MGQSISPPNSPVPRESEDGKSEGYDLVPFPSLLYSIRWRITS